ncbi:hypothetical protein [Nocardia sp. NPDC046763]|uniref:hypothetical protein n=1 Tax=Nocardia sp. NPDC046763 TaxID=3155256 RepID=UPI0033EC1DB8
MIHTGAKSGAKGSARAKLPEPIRTRLLALIAPLGSGGETPDGDAEDGRAVLAAIRSDPGNVSLNTMLTEIAKLETVRVVGVPGDVFADVGPKIVTGWRGRAAVESPSHLRDHPLETQLTLLAALLCCWSRAITDTLVELLNSTVHRINARAEVRVTNELIKEFKRVTGKENLLFKVGRGDGRRGRQTGARHGVPGRAAGSAAGSGSQNLLAL